MPNDAHVNLYGNLVAEPKNDQYNGQTRLTFSMGVKTTRKQEGSQYYESDFYNVTMWGKQAEAIMPYLHKGSSVWVIGDQMLRTYKDRNGVDRTTISVNASFVKLISKPSNGSGHSNSGHTQNNANTAQEPQNTGVINEDEDPPF